MNLEVYQNDKELLYSLLTAPLPDLNLTENFTRQWWAYPERMAQKIVQHRFVLGCEPRKIKILLNFFYKKIQHFG